MNEKGVFQLVPLLLLASFFGLIVFTFSSNFFVFKNPQFAQLFPKKQSDASSPKSSRKNASSPSPSCQPKPACLDAEPRCLRNEPLEGWCPISPKVISTIIDPSGSVYATYQSHNQKVVSNQNGIFLTHIHETFNKDQSFETDVWRLAKSADGGQTFITLYEATSSTRAPVIETDSSSNIYVVAANWSNPSQAQFYKFSPANNYTSPLTQTTLNLGTTSAKFAMEIDEARSQLYYFTLSDTFTIIDFNGKIKNQFKLTKEGTSGFMHYPSLYLDENGHLYAAWTTTNMASTIYWSIHFIKSEDGGINWKKANGQNLTLPVIADESGASEMITLDDEFTSHTWLSSFSVKKGKAHFTYYTRSPLNRQHYVRFDLASNAIDKNIYPEFAGIEGAISLDTLDGGNCVPYGKTAIYCIGRLQNPYGVAVLKSSDEGLTWHDHAVSDPPSQFPIYAIGGSPKITSDGYIIGTYTESDFSNPAAPRVVKFFKVPI